MGDTRSILTGLQTVRCIRLSPTIPPISIPPIYYHSLTNYLFNVFEFKKIIQYLYCHNTHYHRVTGLKRD